MTVLITGASGFVGTIVAKEASRRGYAVHGCGRSSSPPASFADLWHSVAWEQSSVPLLKIIECVKPEIIVHAAGSASVAGSLKAPLQDLQASLGSWSLLLEAVRLSGQKPTLVFPSSAAVYGNPTTLPVTETAECKPVSPYGWHKLLCEGLAHAHANAFDASIVIARLFSVFGRHQRRLLMFELFDRLRSDDGPLKIMGTGSETRDFLGEETVAAALLDLALAKANLPVSGEALIVNVASGNEVSTLQMAQALTQQCAAGREIVCCGQPRPGDPLRWCADVTRLKILLPSLRMPSLHESLQQAIQGWQS